MNRDIAFLDTSLNILGTYSFSSLSNFLVDVPQQFQAETVGSNPNRTYVWNTFGFYGQDEWRLTSRLTLNLGLRYEFNTTVSEVKGAGSSVHDVLTDTPATVAIAPPVFKNPSLNNFAPRIGFALDPMGDTKTVIRGGFGIFYDINQIIPAADVGSTGTPPFATQFLTTTGLRFPSTPVPTVSQSLGAVSALRTIEYYQGQPRMLGYNLTVERQLPGSMRLSVAYAGSRGLDLIQTVEGDPIAPQILAGGQEFWPATAPRMNPAWTYCECKVTGGDSYYNSLQMSLQKRLTHNLQFQASYTFSKLLDDTVGEHGGEAGGSKVTGTDPFHLKTDKGPADYDDPHYFVFNTLYSLPSPAVSGIVGGIAKGWHLGTILTVNSGLPFTAYLSANRSRSGVLGGGSSGPDRPDLIPGCNLILGGPNEYFNPACFSIQPAGYLGTEGRNIMLGPLHLVWDFSLMKDTPIRALGEGRHLEFRAEFFNILNRADFNIPTTGLTVYTATATSATTTPLSTAGQISSTIEPSREIQFALKLIF